MKNKLIRTLRKGGTFLEISEGNFGSFNVNAIDTELELKEDYAVFRTTLNL